MVAVYCSLIIKRPQLKTFAQVPDKLKEEVKTKLFEMGYDTNGDPISFF